MRESELLEDGSGFRCLPEHRNGRREKVMTSVFLFLLFVPMGSQVLIIHAVHGMVTFEEEERERKEQQQRAERRSASASSLLSALLSASVS